MGYGMDRIVLVLQTVKVLTTNIQYNMMKMYKLVNSENVNAITETSLQP